MSDPEVIFDSDNTNDKIDIYSDPIPGGDTFDPDLVDMGPPFIPDMMMLDACLPDPELPLYAISGYSLSFQIDPIMTFASFEEFSSSITPIFHGERVQLAMADDIVIYVARYTYGGWIWVESIPELV